VKLPEDRALEGLRGGHMEVLYAMKGAAREREALAKLRGAPPSAAHPNGCELYRARSDAAVIEVWQRNCRSRCLGENGQLRHDGLGPKVGRTEPGLELSTLEARKRCANTSQSASDLQATKAQQLRKAAAVMCKIEAAVVPSSLLEDVRERVR
jgi:hypothetical protein